MNFDQIWLWQIHRVDPNKNPWKIWEKRERDPGTVKIFWVHPIISGMGKATNFTFCTHIRRIDRNKSPLKISAKVAVGVFRTDENFQGTHRVHTAVIFAIAQLSYVTMHTWCVDGRMDDPQTTIQKLLAAKTKEHQARIMYSIVTTGNGGILCTHLI